MNGLPCRLANGGQADCEACAAHARFLADLVAIGERSSPAARELDPLLLDVLHAEPDAQDWLTVYRIVQDAVFASTAGADEARLRLAQFLEENNDLAVAAMHRSPALR